MITYLIVYGYGVVVFISIRVWLRVVLGKATTGIKLKEK